MRAERAHVLVGLLAAAWLIAVLTVDLVWRSPTFSLAVLYPLAGLIACAVLPPLSTSLVSGLSLGLALGSGAWNHEWGTRQQAVRLLDSVLVAVAAVVIATIRAHREERYGRMVAIADAAQRAVLPRLPEQVGTISIAARYMSAATDALVGGDLYDCYTYAGLTRFVVGDVRGKGVAAAEQAARVIRAFRQAAARAATLSDVAADMNAYLESFLDEEEFITVLLVDASNPDQLTMVSAGHPPPLLVGADGQTEELVLPAGLPLGLPGEFRSTTVEWRSGDRLLLYTDGLIEARDRRRQFLSVSSIATRLRERSAAEGLDELMREVREHVGSRGLEDDLALVLLERLPEKDARVGGADPGVLARGEAVSTQRPDGTRVRSRPRGSRRRPGNGGPAALRRFRSPRRLRRSPTASASCSVSTPSPALRQPPNADAPTRRARR